MMSLNRHSAGRYRCDAFARVACGGLLAWGAGTVVVAADDFPIKPVRIIVPFGAGGTSDVVTRVVSPVLSEIWKQQVVVDNRPGAGGMIGSELAARAMPDGYTLVMAAVATHGIGPHLYRNLRFDPVRDFAPVSLLASTPSVVLMNSSSPVGSVKELIALAKSGAGPVLFGSAGNGGSLHMAGELFGSMSGARLTHVPYRGTAAALVDLMSGQIHVMFDTLPSAVPHIGSGKLKALAVTSAVRTRAFPQLPTVGESGIPGYEVTSWYGPLAPAGTPPAVIRKLNADFLLAIKAQHLQTRLSAVGADPVGSTPEQFAAFIRTELQKWEKVVRESGARLD